MENMKGETVFKVPKLMIGPRPGTTNLMRCVDIKSPTAIVGDKDATSMVVDITENANEHVREEADRLKKIEKKTSSTFRVPIPYEEPSWGGKPGDKYFLEVWIPVIVLLLILAI